MANHLSETQVDLLLDKLSSDDDFRARFQANPRKAMSSIGLDDDSIPETPVKQLADKAAIAASRTETRMKLIAGQYPHVPIILNLSR